ncbi:MAG: carboxypeptidase-like regulatory domain-containing protein [Candidatus Eisenbacteria bacterium]|uniref:Carboxypeptidase-like regulatory domain-containing protein n=1 Tax=Eiseniibacteriota bacterium TaxID=2212470 RepID=A0A948W843_UNCEI|nr:carboxypeptidase-like regulatory domain-containing protein [Candidatus Eisenbacteria bacterium]MBU1948594.1 carboxypeptidase-like regulatory domain-containing protein [Candidatus Eisenbacteria bacterium]MBU2693279.1 carboxypeptidase-like regulatory domain-containing protein [Candidatus Eisenbacteria bacterium]
MRYCRFFPILISALLLLLAACGDDDCSTKPSCPGQEKIFGTVTGGLGPIAGARLRILTLKEMVPGQQIQIIATTDSAGRFNVAVPPGYYGVELTAPGLYQPLWYSENGLSAGISEADTLSITSAGDSIRVDFILGGLEIHLQTPTVLDGMALICGLEEALSAHPQNQARSDPQSGERTFTFEVVPSGDYFVKITVFNPEKGNGSSFWLPSALDRPTAESFHVDPMNLTSATREIPEPAALQGAIGGRWAELEAGRPNIRFYNAQETVIGSHSVDESGVYNIPIFAAGSLRLRVSMGYSDQWIGGEDYSSAHAFDIVPGNDFPVDDISIGGLQCLLVGDPEWEPYNATIEIFNQEGTRVTMARPDQDNTLPIPLFSADIFKLRMKWNGASSWRPQWFDRATSIDEATALYLPAEGEIVSVLITLEEGGTIAGGIIKADGEPASEFPLAVIAVDPEWSWSNYWRTSSDGAYLIEGLPDGEFIVGVRHSCPECNVVTWYPGTTEQDSAQTITILDAQDVTGIDFQLQSTLSQLTP